MSNFFLILTLNTKHLYILMYSDITDVAISEIFIKMKDANCQSSKTKAALAHLSSFSIYACPLNLSTFNLSRYNHVSL